MQLDDYYRDLMNSVQTNADVYEVRITTGNAALGKNVKDDKKRDLVVMDDLLYAEPDAIR